MHNWNLENIYSKQIKLQTPVPLPDRLKVLGEEVALYKKEGEDYTLLGNVDNEFYNNTLSKYIKIGSSESAQMRKTVCEILSKNRGCTPENLNTFQSYTMEGNFTLNPEALTKSESVFHKCVSENTGIMLDEFLKISYGTVEVYNQYFNNAWTAIPSAAVMGRAGEGELFLAFFCNGSKPEKGDLKVGSEDVEIKGFNGRLYKSKKIDISKSIEILTKADYVNETELLKELAVAIGIFAGVDTYDSEIFNLISQPEIRSVAISNYKSYLSKKRLPNFNILIKIAGIVQLLAYKEVQKFDSILAFNNKLPNGVWLQFINLKDINSLADMYSRVENLPSVLRTQLRTDGFGFSLTVSPK
jgi:hypothetical protein